MTDLGMKDELFGKWFSNCCKKVALKSPHMHTMSGKWHAADHAVNSRKL